MISLAHGCPPSTNYSPCNCTANTLNATIRLDCSHKNLTDSKTSQILRSFISVRGMAKQLEELNFSYNRLTKVPDKIRQFHHARLIDLSNNKIRSIQSGAFKMLSNHSSRISLDSNRIASIEPRAIRGTFLFYLIILL